MYNAGDSLSIGFYYPNQLAEDNVIDYYIIVNNLLPFLNSLISLDNFLLWTTIWIVE